MLGLTYGFLHRELRHNDVHILYCLVLWGLGTLGTAAVAAVAVATEREAGTWPILLATPLGGLHIMAAKAAGVLTRGLPLWIPLFLHLFVFLWVGYVGPAVPFHMAVIAAGVAAFVTGAGLYFGSRLRKTTSAIMATAGLCIFLWGAVPLAWAALGWMARLGQWPAEWIGCLNPAVQVVVVTERTTGAWTERPDFYWWPDPLASLGLAATTVVLALTACGYGLAGLAFAWSAARGARRHVF